MSHSARVKRQHLILSALQLAVLNLGQTVLELHHLGLIHAGKARMVHQPVDAVMVGYTGRSAGEPAQQTK